MVVIKNAEHLEDWRTELLVKTTSHRKSISVCTGTGCMALGSHKILEALRAEIEHHNLDAEVELRPTGCHGFCERGPLVLLRPGNILYQRVQPGDIAEIISKSVMSDEIIDRLLVTSEDGKEKYPTESDIPFYRHQQRLILKNNGLINPNSLEDYIQNGGYRAFGKALQMGAERVLDQIIRSGLRGRGGGGFPTGKKWEICRSTKERERYLICNADEGDPGAFMDRSVLEGNPHCVIEGMLIGALVIGAQVGFVYVRQEYPLAVERLNHALTQARNCGLLGKDIFTSGLNFDIQVHRGGGAFVCGEESALIASIEGRRGVPRKRPPYPAVSGLWGRPTNINNVETWANIPPIVDQGSDWYASIGTESSRGTKIFSLVGKVNNTGLVEVPMGMSLRSIVYDIGGGIRNHKKLKAVQTGGPSGGCLPEEKLDIPVDFDTLVREGAMMGSGGMIVMDEDTCMVDVARYFLRFLKSESCGNCTSCRDGLIVLHQLLTDITEGRGNQQTLQTIQNLAATIRATSLCALGRTSVNPVLSTLRYFYNEYLEHTQNKRCPAGVCKALIHYSIDPDLCNGCTLCVKHCPSKAIEGQKKQVHTIDSELCIKCNACRDVCKQHAVSVQ